MKLFVSIPAFMATVLPALAGFRDPIVLESPNPETGGLFGAEGVAYVPDVNSDGLADIVVPALGERAGTGRVYVFDGATHQVITTIEPDTLPSGAGLGEKVAGIADINGNGSGEVIAATHGSDNTVYLFDGATGDPIPITLTMRTRSLSSVPDANGDGIPEILASTQGQAVIYSGRTRRIHQDLAPPAGSSQFFGWACSGAPDFNEDGWGDAIVGDWGAGKAYLFDGFSGALYRTLEDPDGAGGAFGRSVAGIEDVDGDGFGDVIVGASAAGKVHLFNGSTGELIRTFLDPVSDGLGWVVGAVPDTTGDGRMDILTTGYIPSSLDNVYVFDSQSFEHSGTLPGNRDFGGGDSIAGMPDTNGDGLGEVILSNWTATSSAGHLNAGQVLLYLSRPAARLHIERSGENVMLLWEAGSATRLQVSTDGVSWDDIVGVDPESTSWYSEPLGLRGPSCLYRLATD